MRFESRRGPKRKKKRKIFFCKLGKLIFILVIFSLLLAFTFERWFLKLEVAFP